MRTKRFLSAIILVALAFQIASAQQGELASKTITLDKAAFDQSLTGAVGPKVMGYQYVLIKDGRVVTEKADGVARTAQDGGPLKMTVNTPINLGSLQKFITGTALLNIMEKPWVYSPDKDKPLAFRIEKKGHCSGEGGYHMSARDFADYAAHFSASDLIVSKAGRDAMFTEGMQPDDRLVWTAATNDGWMGTNFKMPVVVWSNGIPANGKTVFVRLPQNYYLILFTNSDELSVSQLYGAGVAAFKAGMQHNFN